MHLLINGLPYFSSRLAQDLQQAAPEHRFRFYDTYNSRVQQVRFALALRRASGMVSMNGVSDRSGSLDLALKQGKKLWMQWQGTDVLLALERYRNGTLYRGYIDAAVHATDAPWLQDELASIGIDARIAHYKWLDLKPDSRPFEHLQVYSYIAEGKEAFYGWPAFSAMARAFPDLAFVVAGSSGKNLNDIPSNVQFRGWIDKAAMQMLQHESAIFVRLTAHDGFSLSVLEALAHGSEVIWNQAFPLAHRVGPNDKPEMVLGRAVELLERRVLARNAAHMNYIGDQFNRDAVMRHFIHQLTQVFES